MQRCQPWTDFLNNRSYWLRDMHEMQINVRELKLYVRRTGNQTSGTPGRAGGVRKTYNPPPKKKMNALLILRRVPCALLAFFKDFLSLRLLI